MPSTSRSTSRPAPHADAADATPPTALTRLRALLGRSGRAPRGAGGFEGMESLENRILLGGDHPNFDLPLTENSGTLIVLDPVTGEGSETGTLEVNGDKDLFRFTALADDFVTVWADVLNANGSTLDSRVEVYTIEGPPPIASGSNNGTLTGGTIKDGWTRFIAEAGKTYFVVVMSDVLNGGLGATGDYILRIDGLTTTLSVETDFDPMDPQLQGIALADGTIALRGDDQVFRLVVPEGEPFDSLATFTAIADSLLFNARLDVYDAAGKLVAFDSDAGRLTNAFTTRKVVPGETYFVRVRSDRFVQGDATATGDFTLRVDTSALDMTIDPVTRRGVEGGAIPDTALSGLFEFIAQGTGLTFITVRGAGLPPLPDPAVRVHGADGQFIHFNKLGGAAELRVQLVGGQRYFVIVEAFDDPNPGGYAVFVEAHHTFTDDQINPDQSIDDHADTPDLADPELTPEQIRRAFEQATPLIWNDAILLKDANGNPIADRSYVSFALGTGRIWGAGDTDLFQFVPPMDMLGSYPGDDGNEDAALYIGGAGTFTLHGRLDPPDYELFTQDFLAIYDAGDKFWPVQRGLNGQVYASTVFDPDGDGPALPVLVVGGAFTETLDPFPFTLDVPFIAAWVFNPLAGRYQWFPLGDGLDAPVRALTVFDLDGEEGPNPPSLIAGGEFPGGLQAWTGDILTGAGSWSTFATVDDTVHALTVYDPPDIDPLGDPFLVFGGDFTGHLGFYFTDGSSGLLHGGVNGPVYALGSYDPTDPQGGPEAPNELIVGGQFTQAFGGNPVSNIVGLTYIEDDDGVPLPLLDTMGGGLPSAVFALTTWDPSAVFPLIGNQLIAGGQFGIAQWDDASWAEMDGGMNGPVRALASFEDEEYVLIQTLNAMGGTITLTSLPGVPTIFAGGDFTEVSGFRPANRLAQFLWDDVAGAFTWAPLGAGTDATVYTMTPFNDEIAGLWDRGDRTATRLQIVVSPDFGSFVNTFLRVYDSNFELIYENDTIAPPFPDPSGMVDPSTIGTAGTPFEGIEVWGGEVYYIEVSPVSGTGRYQVQVRADAVPPDLNDDLVFDDVHAQYFQPPPAGEFEAAPEIGLNSFGDGRNFTPLVLSAYNARFFDHTPSGFRSVQFQELGLIGRIGDSDLYLIRSPMDGPIEVRINTTNLQDQHGERITNLRTGTFQDFTKNKTYNSPLDAKISVYTNDFVLLGTSETNAALQGEFDTTYAGGFNDRTFFRRDPRFVFDSVAANTYFILVESAQAAAFAADPSTVDWRRATGSYELLVNAIPDLSGGDDHGPPAAVLETVIPIDETLGSPTNGSGSVRGVILDTPQNPNDVDSFSMISPATGPTLIRVEREQGSLVIPFVTVVDVATGQVLAQGSANNEGVFQATFLAFQGSRYSIRVTGSGDSQGSYVLSVTGAPFTDDHANEGRWHEATELEILDFLGRATANGVIEHAGDTDVFRFTTPAFDLATITVEPTGGGLNAMVRVYEVSVDPVGRPVLLQIGFSDRGPNDGPGAETTFSVTAPPREHLDTGEVYNTYYVLVAGRDPETQSGSYQVRLSVTPTDDHPDAGEWEFATAVPIDPAQGRGDAEGVIEQSGDTDLFRFTAPAGGPASITVAAAEGSALRPVVRVFDADLNPVINTGNGLDFAEGADEPGSSATFTFNAQRNRVYFVLVEGADGSVTVDSGAYTVAITTGTADDHPNIGEFDIATKISLAVKSGNGLATGAIEVQGDTDLFFFQTWEPGTHVVTVSTPQSPMVARLRIFNSNGQLILNAFDGNPNDEDGAKNGSVTLTVNALAPAEVYFILVNAHPSGSATGAYTVFVDGQPPENPPPDNDDDHADAGEFFIATPIVLDPRTGEGSELGLIEKAGDTDVFVLSTFAGGPIFIQVVTPLGGLVDLSVKVFGADEELIVTDSQGFAGANAAARVEATGPSQIFYIEVGAVGAGTGSYTVRVATQPEFHYLYMPEGFAHEGIREYVSIANPNDTDVTYDVTIYYEDEGLAPVMLVEGAVIAAGTRGGLTLSAGGGAFLEGIVANKPYSIVIRSDKPLGANLSHYDFGFALGESFTKRTSTTWTFAQAERLAGFVNDFITFFNPNTHDVLVTLTALSGEGVSTISKTVGALRRGGWNLAQEGSLPLGTFGVIVTSEAANGEAGHIGVVASLSHYDTADQEGDLVLGDPDGGHAAGVIPVLTRGNGEDPSITFFNPGNSSVSVTLRGDYLNINLPTFTRIFNLDAGEVVTLAGDGLGVVADQPFGVRYTATGDVTVLARSSAAGDSTATQSFTEAGTDWFFGDAYINSALAGTLYRETLAFYNPDFASDLTITITLLFHDGTSAAVTRLVGFDDFASVRLHELPAILGRPGENFFSISVSAARPFVVNFTHYDLFLGGGWGTSGAPLGLVNPLDEILS